MHDSRALRVAIVGLGGMGRTHLACIRRLRRSRVVAIAEPRPDLRHGADADVQWFSDPEEMLRTVHPDVVHVATPPSTHYRLASLSLAHGAHVYVEKPFVPTADEAVALLERAEQAGRKVCAGHQMVFQKASVRGEQRLGAIGRVVHVESFFSFNPWIKNAPRSELLIDVLPHAVYAALQFVPRPADARDAFTIEWVDTDPRGEARVLLRAGDVRVSITASMTARPPDHFVRVVGTDGTLVVDYVRSILVAHPGSADVITALMQPFRTSLQMTAGALASFAGFAAGGESRLPGLASLVARFHDAILDGGAPPVPPARILGTVRICEAVARSLASHSVPAPVRSAAEQIETPVRHRNERVAVTGGTGFIGTVVARTLVREGWPVRVIGRRVPLPQDRVPGVEYVAADLGDPMPPATLEGASWVVHCAAATSGGAEEHRRNTVAATRHIHDACVAAGVRGLIYMSSLGVMRARPWYSQALVSEQSPIETVHDGRGQYVRGKTEGERLLHELVAVSGLPYRVLRPGAVLDSTHFEAPGCLGRELGGRFFTVGGKSEPVATCDVHMLGAVVARYVEAFDTLPRALNVIDPDQPTRAELVDRLRRDRPGLRVTRIPASVVVGLTWVFSAVQKLLSPGKRALNLRSAFYLDRYDASLTRKVLDGRSPDDAVPRSFVGAASGPEARRMR